MNRVATTILSALITATLPACTFGTSALSEAESDAGTEQLSQESGEGIAAEGPLTVLMIVDRSGSMTSGWEGTPKWKVARDAVSFAIEGVEEQLTAGALLFPIPEACSVAPLDDPSQIDFRRGDAFLEAWESNAQISAPEGSTPLGEAFRQADRAIDQAREDGRMEGRFRVVLVSDGAPTCLSAEEEVVGLANKWREAGIDVRVMGLPGSDAAAALLNRIAGEEVVEDEETGELIVPESDSSWTAEPGEATGYIEPESSDDVDESFYHAVR